MTYDSKKDTLEHIEKVKDYLIGACNELYQRGKVHDASKLESPEKEYFDRLTPLLAGVEYGSEEYKEQLEQLRPALEHHYASNSHHPQHYENGINGFNLFDLVEMFYDWKASSERHDTGDIRRSIEINKDRFGMSDQLYQILLNTIDYHGW